MKGYLNKIIGQYGKVLFFVFLVFLIISFSGCRKKCNENSSDYPDCLEKPVAEERKTVFKPETKTLYFWNLYDAEDAFSGQIQAFQSSHPNVKVVYKKRDNESIYKKELINEIAEGRGPDIFVIHHSWLNNFQGKITPAPEEIIIPEKVRENFFPVVSDLVIKKDSDDMEKVYALPMFLDTLAIYYNKSVFKESLQNTTKPGKTWREIKEQVFTITETDNSAERFSISGVAIGRSDNIKNFADILLLMLLQYDTKIFDEEMKKSIIAGQQGTSKSTGKSYYPGIEAFDLFTSFASRNTNHYSWNEMITGFYPEQKDLGVFLRGKTAMIFGYSTLYTDLRAILEGKTRNRESTIKLEDIGISEVPQLESELEGGKKTALADFYPLVVSRNSQNPELAWEFIEYITAQDSAREYHKKTNKPTALVGLLDEQVVENTFGIFARQIEYAKVVKNIDKDDFISVIKDIISVINRAKMDIKTGVGIIEKRLSCIAEKYSGKYIDKECSKL